jgi:type IV fimbrial biogenesis protein FimT
MLNQTHPTKTCDREQNGFSLIELLFLLALSASLLLYTLPSYQSMKTTIESRITLTRLLNLIYYARSESIRTGRMITFCKSENGKTCSGTWSSGQILFINAEKPRILLRLPKTKGNLHFYAFQSTNFLRFTPKGNTFEQNGTFVYCPTQNPHLAHALIIEKSGEVRISKDADRDGVDEDAEGKPIKCRAD